jgi:hypothetical protein
MSDFIACHACGANIHITAPACPKCGAPQKAAIRHATPQSESSSIPSVTAAAGESPKWQKVFALIDKAGGAALPNKGNLTKVELRRIRANGWAAVFNVLYYLFKGMWKKALLIWLAYFAAVIVADMIGTGGDLLWKVATLAVIVYCAMNANIDYYRKKRGESFWW